MKRTRTTRGGRKLVVTESNGGILIPKNRPGTRPLCAGHLADRVGFRSTF